MEATSGGCPRPSVGGCSREKSELRRIRLAVPGHGLTHGVIPSCLKKQLGNTPAVSFFTTQMERVENGQEDETTARYAAAAAYLGKHITSRIAPNDSCTNTFDRPCAGGADTVSAYSSEYCGKTITDVYYPRLFQSYTISS